MRSGLCEAPADRPSKQRLAQRSPADVIDWDVDADIVEYDGDQRFLAVSLEPKYNSSGFADKQARGEQRSHYGQTASHQPRPQRGRRTQHRAAYDFDEVINGIDFGDDGRVSQRAYGPHDRSSEHHQLNDCADDRLDVAVAGTKGCQNSSYPGGVDDNEEKAGKGEKRVPVGRHSKIDRNRNENDDGVQKHDEIAVNHAEHVSRERQFDL